MGEAGESQGGVGDGTAGDVLKGGEGGYGLSGGGGG